MIWDFRILYSKKDDLRANFQPIFLTLCKLHFFLILDIIMKMYKSLYSCTLQPNDKCCKVTFLDHYFERKRQQSLVVTNQQWLSFGLWLFRSRI